VLRLSPDANPERKPCGISAANEVREAELVVVVLTLDVDVGRWRAMLEQKGALGLDVQVEEGSGSEC
jgi:hypothetical protein